MLPECKKGSLVFLGLGSWQGSDRDLSDKKYGRKFWDLEGRGKEGTEFRCLTARCRKGVWEETRDLAVWQSDGKTIWEAYNFGYADKGKRRNQNTEDRSWLSEKSGGKKPVKMWRCEWSHRSGGERERTGIRHKSRKRDRRLCSTGAYCHADLGNEPTIQNLSISLLSINICETCWQSVLLTLLWCCSTQGVTICCHCQQLYRQKHTLQV